MHSGLKNHDHDVIRSFMQNELRDRNPRFYMNYGIRMSGVTEK